MSLQVPLSGASQTTLATLAAIASSASGSSARVGGCNIYVGAEPTLHHEKEQATACLTLNGMHFQENDPVSASHFLLFITDSFLKSKDHLLPLIKRLQEDPHFKQRLFAIVMDDNIKKHIYPAGGEEPYVQYWSDILKGINNHSSQYGEVERIRDNIALFIQTLRVTLMPNSLEELLKDDMAMVTDVIKKRTHLFEKKRFFSLPLSKANIFSGRETALADLSSVLARKSVSTISGEKGIGKTALAVEYTKRSEIYSTGIFWIDASKKETLDEGFQSLASQLGTSPDHAKRELLQMKDFLLIYDNVTDPTLIPQINSGHAIVLGTGLQNPDIVVGRFTEAEAIQYIMGQIKATSDEARDLSKLVENHPGKLTEAIEYIKRIKIPIRKYLNSGLVNPPTRRQVAGTTAVALAADCDIIQPSTHPINTYTRKTAAELFQDLKDQDIQIFVSYNWGAFDEVNKIDKVFEDHGIQVLRDTREARPFESLRKFMKKVVRVADYTFSIVSEKYIKSFNCLYEIITTMKDPYWKSRVFPIIITGTALDDAAIESYKQHWLKEAERIERVGGSATEVAIARDGADKIVKYLAFVNQVQPAELGVQLNSKFQNTLALMLARQEKLEKKGLYKQDIFHLPMGRNKLFTGREKEMRELETALNQGKFSAITNIGMGGVGKTQLALEYAYKNQSKYKMIYWIRAEDLDTLKSDLRMLGGDMEIAEDFLKDDKLIPTMKAQLEKSKDWLIVFDNAQNAEALNTVMPQKGGHVIVTSRDPHWKQALKLDVYSPEEALSYLQKISAVTGQDEELRQLAKDLGYLPLALTQAGAYIKRQQIDVATYRTEYQRRQKEFLSHKEKGYPESVATTWLISMEKIQQEDPNATMLLQFCSYLAPDDIPAEILESWLSNKKEIDVGLAFHDALAILESYSMINQKAALDGIYRKLVSVHRLVQTVTRDQCDDETAKDIVQGGVGVFCDLFHAKVDTRAELKAADSLVEHAKALMVYGDFMIHSDTQKILSERVGVLATKVGEFLWKIGQLQSAKEMWEKSLEIFKQIYGTENHPNVALSYNGLGLVLKDQGNLKKAKDFHEKALKICSTLFSEEDEGMTTTYSNIASVLKAQGDLQGAKELYEKVIDIKRNKYVNEDNLSLASSYNNLALVLQAQGDLKGARQMYEASLKTTIKNLGSENNTEVAKNYANLGNVYADEGNLKSAKEMYENALKIFISVFETENHPNVADIYNNLGLVLQDQGVLKRAKEMHEKALNIKLVVFNTENHPSVAESYNNLGRIFQGQGDLQNAKKMYEMAISTYSAAFGDDKHFKIAMSYNNLGLILQALGDLMKAEEMLKKALNIFIATLGTKHASVAECYGNLGSVFFGRGDLKSSKEMHETALSIYSTLEVKNPAIVARTYANLGNVLKDQEKKDLNGAKMMYEEALKLLIASQNIAACQAYLPMVYNYLGIVLKDLGDLNRAKEMHENALKVQIAALGTEEHENVGDSYSYLGLVLQAQNNLSEAKKTHEKALKIKMDSLKIENHESIARSHKHLGDTCLAMHQANDARQHYLKAKQICNYTDGAKYDIFFDGKIRECDNMGRAEKNDNPNCLIS